jgi:hypothetical protein
LLLFAEWYFDGILIFCFGFIYAQVFYYLHYLVFAVLLLSAALFGTCSTFIISVKH